MYIRIKTVIIKTANKEKISLKLLCCNFTFLMIPSINLPKVVYSSITLLKLVKVLLYGILSLRHVDHTTQLGVICRLAEGLFDLAV